MRLTVDVQQMVMVAQHRKAARVGTLDGLAYAATGPTREPGQDRPNPVPDARFAGIGQRQPLDLHSTELAARLELGRHLSGRCRVTPFDLLGVRVLVLLTSADLAPFDCTWDTFESRHSTDSQEIADFVRRTPDLDGLVTRSLMTPSARNAVLLGDHAHLARARRAAYRLTLAPPRRRLAGD